MKQNRQWYYRGSLKSCNYSCSYCPFSKKKSSSGALETDREQFFRFIERLEGLGEKQAAVQIVLYGEALIHSYYWEGLARLSNISGMEAVGAQSNLSFPVEKMLDHFLEKGGQLKKLRLWGTFHPEMTSVERFLQQCEYLSKRQVTYCVGAVGDPVHLPEIQRLRKKLDASVYLWINKMDGLGRNYTEEEIAQFLEMDEYFDLELRHYRSDVNFCGNQIFVEADGSMRRCNLCRPGKENLYEMLAGSDTLSCTRKECSCYLAYNNRRERELLFFEPYPAFRIPVYPRAVFLDVDGTLVQEGQKQITEEACRQIKALSKHSALYLATSLPLERALQKVRGIHEVLSGGVFANGGRCIVFQDGERDFYYDRITPMEGDWIKYAEQFRKKYGYHLHVYEKEGKVYKVTLSFPKKKALKKELDEIFLQELIAELRLSEECRWYVEDHCVEIINKDRGKLAGILEIMEEMRYRKDEIFVAGNAGQDQEMLTYFPWSVRV